MSETIYRSYVRQTETDELVDGKNEEIILSTKMILPEVSFWRQ